MKSRNYLSLYNCIYDDCALLSGRTVLDHSGLTRSICHVPSRLLRPAWLPLACHALPCMGLLPLARHRAERLPSQAYLRHGTPRQAKHAPCQARLALTHSYPARSAPPCRVWVPLRLGLLLAPSTASLKNPSFLSIYDKNTERKQLDETQSRLWAAAT